MDEYQYEGYAGVPVYVFTLTGTGDGDRYTGYHGATNDSGYITFTLPLGNYRFRADYNGVQFWSDAQNDCRVPGCEYNVVTISGGLGTTTTTIDYTYDPLYRLTAADYSDDRFFHYTYDPVGNRLTQETQDGTTIYLYDDANRLSSADGVAYTWDANGNLLSDGVNTYTYDSANRLVGFGGQDVYGYNGLGDRLSYYSTNYTLDLAAGLPQVLNEGTDSQTTDTYIYGQGRIADDYGYSEYYLADALGSVRQVIDEEGLITLTRTYAPYGEVIDHTGYGYSNFGFTGEMTDYNGLVYLRARYYSPAVGRFLSRDSWGGDPDEPMSYNAWLYVYGNPINGLDPSGMIPIECTITAPKYWHSIPECPGYSLPETEDYNEKIPPKNITWFPERDPLYFGARGIPRNTNAAQFLNGNTGLCGEVALAAITGIPVQEIVDIYIVAKTRGIIYTEDVPPNYTGPGTLVQIVNKVMADIWSAQGNYWPEFVEGQRRDRLPDYIHNWLAQNKYIITGVEIINGSSYPDFADVSGQIVATRRSYEDKITHWVVVTGMSLEWSSNLSGGFANDKSPWNWVRVYNPFDNQTEYYWWPDFQDAWTSAGNMIVLMSRSL